MAFDPSVTAASIAANPAIAAFLTSLTAPGQTGKTEQAAKSTLEDISDRNSVLIAAKGNLDRPNKKFMAGHETQFICIPKMNRGAKVAAFSALLTGFSGLALFTALKVVLTAGCSVLAATGVGAAIMFLAVAVAASIYLMVKHYKLAGQETKINNNLRNDFVELIKIAQAKNKELEQLKNAKPAIASPAVAVQPGVVVASASATTGVRQPMQILARN